MISSKHKTKDEKLQMLNGLSQLQKEARQVYAVATGCPVQHSGVLSNCVNFNCSLDYNISGVQGWVAPQCKIGVWIQVSCQQPKFWTDVIIQGVGGCDQRVSSFKASSTLTGKLWQNVDEGKQFKGNTDNNQKVRVRFQQPVYARTIRIYPQTYHEHMSMRFDAIYIDLD